ncbi:MAG TPA: type VI secretion system-associated FHA domain protein TagH, partial [Gammaproteobacteria bacterium]|nr:type VI secretion system-associated FHA domain protein TagH [Gammaproteobacteria bacterium]
RGAGLDAQALNFQDKLALMEKVGRLTRNSVEGLMIALRARATVKSSFRVSKTTISPAENNPLKFLVTTNDALNALLSDEKPGYMPAEEALNEGFKDLQNHQMALMAGMQATIETIIKQFDPHSLAQSFNAHGGSSIIPGQKKAKYWDHYADFYAKFSNNFQDDFQNTFGEDFACAYEKQINKLL